MSVSLLSTFVKPMHPEGRRFIAIGAAITVGLFVLWTPLGWIGLGLTIWVYYFFRDPERMVPTRPAIMVSPADGIVSMIEQAVPPADLELGEAEMARISIFMSVFDCHVNRLPAAGRIDRISYRPGKFFDASLDKASEHNERNGLAVTLPDGRRYGTVQIAGLVARRIMCWAEKDQELARGERFGLIRFGSRLDIYLPEGATPLVRVGQTMTAGETVLADLTGETGEA